MNSFVENFKLIHPTYEIFSKSLENLIKQLIQTEEIKYHFIESRAKTVSSFEEKISRPEKKYSDPLSQLPDLAGIRVVLYYLDDVNKIGDLIKREFAVVEEESSHQPSGYSPDKFGYLSMHYVVRLNQSRSLLPEWKLFANFHAEIQVRTVLQHSWAAVSHALQYKHETDVPINLRRKLFRLAGIFELADEEFVAIRDAATASLHETKKAFSNDPSNLKLDSISIKEFLSSWGDFKAIRNKMQKLGYKFTMNHSGWEKESESYMGELVKHCERLKINTIQDFQNAMAYDRTSYYSELKKLLPWDISDEFLLLILLIGSRPEDFTVSDLAQDGWDDNIAETLILAARTGKSG